MPKISVIVPMYNVEKYIRCAIQSVLDQTFKDFELILIDDCSTDKTVEVAKSFNDPRIKILNNEKNLGAGLTRNVGLEIATGDYIYFFDSDDALIPNALEMLYKAAEENNVDMVTGLNLMSPQDNEFKNINGLKYTIIKNGKNFGKVSDDFRKRISEEYIFGGIPAGRFHFLKRKFLQENQIKFSDVMIHEDGTFLLEILCATGNIIKIDKPFYIRRERSDSLTRTNRKSLDYNKFAKYIRAYLKIIKLFEEILNREYEKRVGGKLDSFFIDNVIVGITNRFFFWEVIPYFQTSPINCWKIIDHELELNYKENKHMIRRYLFGYYLERINRQVFEDRSKRHEEKMKSIKNYINNLIK